MMGMLLDQILLRSQGMLLKIAAKMQRIATCWSLKAKCFAWTTEWAFLILVPAVTKNGALSLAELLTRFFMLIFLVKAITPSVTRRLLSTTAVEQGKRAAAYRAVDDVIDSSLSVVGIGSGSTIRYAVDRIQDRHDLGHVTYIPTSFQSRMLIQKANLKLGNLEQYVVQ